MNVKYIVFRHGHTGIRWDLSASEGYRSFFCAATASAPMIFLFPGNAGLRFVLTAHLGLVALRPWSKQ